jgi:hypothetical protein
MSCRFQTFGRLAVALLPCFAQDIYPQSISHFAQATDTNQFSRVVFRNGEFFGFGGTHLARSTDGIRWESLPIPKNGTPSWDLFRFQGKLWITGGHPPVVLSSEDDGKTWTEHERPLWRGSPWGPQYVIENKGRLFATMIWFDQFTGVSYGGQSYSDDGIHWQETDVSAGVRNSFTHGNGAFVVGANNGLWRSTDGTNYSKVPTNFPASVNHVLFGLGVFALVGNGFVAHSADGITWTISEGFGLGSLAINGSLFVGVGGDTVFTSLNGKSWTLTAQLPYGITDQTRSVAYGHGTFIIATRELKHFYSFDPSLWLSGFSDSGAVKLRALGVPGTRYTLQMAEQPTGPWQNAQNFTPLNTEGVMLTNQVGNPQRGFFRLVSQ